MTAHGYRISLNATITINMGNFIQKYSIVSLLNDVRQGTTFSAAAWPPHLTLVDVFAMNTHSGAVAAKLENIALTTEPIQCQITGYDYFGPQQNIHVALLQKSTQLVRLHTIITTYLQTVHAIYNEPQYVNNGFCPHITLPPGETIATGSVVTISNIALIDMFPNDNPFQRTILQRHSLLKT